MDQIISSYKRAISNRNLVVDVLVLLFGVGSWIGINATFLQVPLLVDTAPEKWSLPSYLVLITQMGNIGPLSYTCFQKCLQKWFRDSYIIAFVLLLGVLSSLLIAFLYPQTALINGSPHSLSLFILIFFLALVGCTSSVLFMPYMGRFKEVYLITYLIGEGLSGLLTSIVALIQGVGGNEECVLTNTTNGLIYEAQRLSPRFSTQSFYLFVFFIILCSWICFLLLDNLEICKAQYASVAIINGSYVYDNQGIEKPNDEYKNQKIRNKRQYTMLLLLMTTVCFFGNGIFPSIQSYSCLPYGNIVYHLTASLTCMVNPMASFLAVFLPHKTMRLTGILTFSAILIGVYIMITAVYSPNPPLVDSIAGEILVVVNWTIFMALVTYIKLCVTMMMRSHGGKSLMWTGAASQAGSAIGSICIFFLINFSHIFKSKGPCQDDNFKI